MPPLNWTNFNSLSGSQSQNFEILCRSLIRLHYERYGNFAALKNQPGVEFHLKLTEDCPVLGSPPKWFGWQCKLHERNVNGNLNSASKTDIEDSLKKAEKYLPDLTDWILWTPYTLSKSDQEWFKSLQTKLKLHQWAEEEIDSHLNDKGLILRSSYFGELILTKEELERRHNEAIQSIHERWLEPVHQSVEAERVIRRMLGEQKSWDQMIIIGNRLNEAAETISDEIYTKVKQIEKYIKHFVSTCHTFADTLLHFHETLNCGDLDTIYQKLGERKILIDIQVCATPGKLRTLNLPIALDATNALDDMRIALNLLDEVEKFLEVGLVAVLADAGGGKTQMAAQLTAAQKNGRPAGILLYGKDFHKGQTLDNLASHFSINGNPLTSMEKLLAALDAAGKRSQCRLPLVIDGLNEAENPKEWKDQLAIISEVIKKYSNVLIVCTLRTGEHQRDLHMQTSRIHINARESFAEMALPDNIKKIFSEGFGGDVQSAIEKYFNHYKINSENIEIPVDFFKHPLTLRIFCEVTNPKREVEVRIDYFPASLAPLFEKYVANACKRISQMANLQYPYTVSEVEDAIYILGQELWKSNKREIEEANYRTIISDKQRPWDSSIVNLFAQEGIVFRNPGTSPCSYTITSVYDALGGYIVASSLLKKNLSSGSFKWLSEPDALSAFSNQDSHDLAYDIFKSLVTLTPRYMQGRQLWKEASENYKNTALMFTTEIESKYIDQATIAALLKLLKDEPKRRIQLFTRILGTRAVPNYHLNSKFLDIMLRALSIPERDLSWTEWIRNTRNERFDDLLAIELKWKNGNKNRTQSDYLIAKWIMWFLTSTDHELRDVATRALYWFGRSDPSTLFSESLISLEINDPYVPERMLAASYGVAMARHVDLKDQNFIDEILPKFARNLYAAMFAEKAPFSTTHHLMREYASRIIELSVLCCKSLFSPDEIRRCKPPFLDSGIREWQECKISKEEIHGLDSPFRMDFENYTIGRLVPGRSNYDFKNENYCKIRSQILWRIEQLGWSNEKFQALDKSIGHELYSPRIAGDANKIDRYGKKYSWIAYFEMSGLLQDQGKLENWRERTSDVDIDPSFPEHITEGILINKDFLGDPQIDLREWVKNGPAPDLNPYLKHVDAQNETWIALDGDIVQEDETRGRKLFSFIRSFLISNKYASSFLENLSRQHLGGRWLPEKPSVIYTFAGEIPWCETYPQNGQTEFSFVTKEERVIVKRAQPVILINDKKIGLHQIEYLKTQIPLLENIDKKPEASENIGAVTSSNIEISEEIVEVEEIRSECAKFDALIPVCDFGWEGYQTVSSNAGLAVTLAKEIASDLELIGQPQTFDLYTKDGVKATFIISCHKNAQFGQQTMFFIREDLLKKYLDKNDLSLIWAIWGERGYSYAQIKRISPDYSEQHYCVFSTVKSYQ